MIDSLGNIYIRMLMFLGLYPVGSLHIEVHAEVPGYGTRFRRVAMVDMKQQLG